MSAAASIKCRLCGYTLESVCGCASCLSAKRNFVFPASEAEVGHTVEELSQDTARLLKGQLRKIKDSLELDPKFNTKLGRELNQLTKALTTLLAEMRRHSEQQKASIARMSRKEQRDLILKEVFATLPEIDRTEWLRAAEQLHLMIKSPPIVVQGN